MSRLIHANGGLAVASFRRSASARQHVRGKLAERLALGPLAPLQLFQHGIVYIERRAHRIR
jgi:hypothetical protein